MLKNGSNQSSESWKISNNFCQCLVTNCIPEEDDLSQENADNDKYGNGDEDSNNTTSHFKICIRLEGGCSQKLYVDNLNCTCKTYFPNLKGCSLSNGKVVNKRQLVEAWQRFNEESDMETECDKEEFSPLQYNQSDGLPPITLEDIERGVIEMVGFQPPTSSQELREEKIRNASRMTNESHDALYRRALTLLSARCNSTIPDDKVNSMHLTPRSYFYINQERPQPMPPLKVWNGYNGNVYFEPIQIVPVNDSLISDTNSTVSSTGDRSSKLLGKRVSSARKDSATIRTLSRQTTKSISVKSGYCPVVILDKDTVLDRFGDDVNEDLTLIEGIECTGSLSTRQRPRSEIKVKDKNQKRAIMYDKEKICKGSVVSKLKESQLGNAQSPLKVHGGKFVPTSTLAPLLRTQTQYSQSNQRLTTNSPDPFHHHLPPLDQIRAKVRHMDTVNQANKSHYTKHQGMGTEIKPFIKYSPVIKAGKPTAYA